MVTIYFSAQHLQHTRANCGNGSMQHFTTDTDIAFQLYRRYLYLRNAATWQVRTKMQRLPPSLQYSQSWKSPTHPISSSFIAHAWLPSLEVSSLWDRTWLRGTWSLLGYRLMFSRFGNQTRIRLMRQTGLATCLYGGEVFFLHLRTAPAPSIFY